jgi:hypothetical protein
MKMLRAGGLLLGLLLGGIGSASASTLDYSFTFSGGGFNGSGDIFVNSTTNVVQNLSGTINGATLQLIAANSSDLYTQPGTGLQWLYNDLFYKTGTPFDNYGLLFSFGSNVVANIYSIGSSIGPQLYLSVSNPIGDYNPGVQINMTVSQTPLPPALLLFLSAMVGLWFLLRRKNASDIGIAFGHPRTS